MAWAYRSIKAYPLFIVTEHTHIHVYANRIDFQGKAFDDSFISNRSAHLAEEIAKKHGLTTAREVQVQKLESHKDLKAEIQQRHSVAMQHKPKNMDEYVNLMKGNKVDVEVVKSLKTGKVSGLRYTMDGNTFKGSEIARKMSFEGVLKEMNLAVKAVSKTVNIVRNIAQGL